MFRLILKIISVIILMLSMPSNTFASGDEFTDIQGHWSAEVVQWGVKEKIVEGYPDRTFRPDQIVTEAEFVVQFLRSINGVLEAAGGDAWDDPYYHLASFHHLPVLGKEVTAQRTLPINRTLVAEIIAAAEGVSYIGDDAVRYILLRGYSEGKNSTYSAGLTIYDYRGQDQLTRAEALQFIKRIREYGLTELAPRGTSQSDPNALAALSGEVLTSSYSDKATSGPVLFFNYEVERGVVYFTSNSTNTKEPAGRFVLKETFNPMINKQIFAIANSLYNPQKEKLTLFYDRKGYKKVEIHFGTYPLKMQNPTFCKPFTYELFEEGRGDRVTIYLNLCKLWGEEKPKDGLDNYYVEKLRASLISILGENDGNFLCDKLVNQFLLLMNDQAKVTDWSLKMNSPEVKYLKTEKISLKEMDVAIITSITQITVLFSPKSETK